MPDLSRLCYCQQVLFCLLNLIFQPGLPAEQDYDVNRDRNYFLALNYGFGQLCRYHVFMSLQGHCYGDASRSFALYTDQRRVLFLGLFIAALLVPGIVNGMAPLLSCIFRLSPL